jgi:predicted DNA-binding protein (MmcQ/YjbR family)
VPPSKPDAANRKPTKQEAPLRDFALGFPGAREDFPWGHRAYKVRNKIFLILGGEENRLNLTVKLPASGILALKLPFAQPTGYGLGKSGWVTVDLSGAKQPPLDMLCEWIDESYRAIAPRKLVAQLDEPGSVSEKRKSAPASTGKKRRARKAE